MGLLISLSLIMFPGVFVSVALSKCSPAHSFSCGKLTNLTYPFWTKSRSQTECSHGKFELYNCSTTEFPSIHIQDQELRVKDINLMNETMKLSLPIDGYCEHLNAANWSQPLPPSLSPIYFSYGCPYEEYPPVFPGFLCGAHDPVYWGIETYMHPPDTVNCKHRFDVTNGTTLDDIRSSTTMQELLDKLLAALQSGIAVSISPSLAPSRSTEPRTGGSNIRLILVIVFGVSGGTALIMSVFFVIYRRRMSYAHSSNYTRNVSSDAEKTGALYGVKFFTYDELKEATDNFSESREIGDGGFGTVYLGTLKDGRIVAVKRLYENNRKKVEQFLNEVDILAHLHHKNLVTLYGCTSRHSRELLLVYEYISNGTVADHLHGENAQHEPLSWLTRLKIAVETANALTYLHASDIIHRDVKTSNILLDDHFNVKVADFGLSRLFPLDVTHVSTAPQGTPGYVDPEYHQCYQLTDKSDVYSFGVVLAELISSKPAVDITRHRHEINLSNMAMNKIQSGALNELVDPSLGFNKDSDVHKMITEVAELAFQCLQSDKELRPSMKQVSEILTRIQCGDSQTTDKAEELDVFSDEFVLLENSLMPPLSPDIMAAQSVSSFKSFSRGPRNFIHRGQYKSY